MEKPNIKKYFVLTSKYFKPFILYQGESATIGRERVNTIHVPSSTLSRTHAEVFIDEENQPFLRDCESRNGTFLNGIAIKDAVRLRSGDRIKLGGLPVYFEEQVDYPEPEEIKEKTTTSILDGLKTPTASGEMMGNLHYMDMLEVLTTINYFQKTGVLNLRHGAKRGSISFRNGEIVSAFFEVIRNVDAIYLMLSMKEGLFVFEPKEVREESKISLTIQQLMMNYAHSLDEASASTDDSFILDEVPENSPTVRQFPKSKKDSGEENV